MDSMDNFRERFEALEQQTEPLKQQTQALEAPTCPSERRRRWWPTAWHVAAAAALGLTLVLPHGVQAKIFHCGAGDVPCLIAAINEANANGQMNTIRLAAGTYTLTAPDNPSNGLPVITSPLTITGREADNTSIARDASAPGPGFRILQVAATGSLTLKRLTVRGGFLGDEGGGILNSGTLTLVHSAVTANRALLGAGISTTGGTVTIAHSTIERNFGTISGGLDIIGSTVTLHATTVTRNFAQGAGGIANGGGTVIITESAITQNFSDNAEAPAGIANGGTMVITNTTVSANRNSADLGGGGIGGIANRGGTLFLTNSTLADNSGGRGGIRQQSGTVLLLNTILAQNIDTGPFSPDLFPAPDCAGSITSLGTNLIGDPTGCTITLQPSDLTGDPGLDAFTDNGRPGKGHFPLLPTSQALDAGNDALCPRTDQLGRRRVGPCDIGAIEFRDRDDRQHDEEDDEPDADPAAMAQGS
jgi:hypothetical protein